MRRASFHVRVVGLGALVAAAGCTHANAQAPQAPLGTLRDVGVGALVDPTVRGARVVPLSVTDAPPLGREAGGGVRAMVAGLRVIKLPGGGVLAAHERLPQWTNASPHIAEVPERLGGGFLFVVGNTVWRADHWLDPVKPIFGWNVTILAIAAGLDRMYLRGANNSFVAINPVTGERGELGPWPRSPQIGTLQKAGFAAADGWRAIAMADLRGLLATNDAGATWRSIDLPADPKDVIALGDRLIVQGSPGPRMPDVWFEVDGDGQVTRLPKSPELVAQIAQETSSEPKPLGDRPLLAAIEGGWPLTDGTTIVARDGALARVRLADGAITDYVKDAFPERPSVCHGISLTRDKSPGAFGFVCGEPRGNTAIYAYDAMKGSLSALRRFDTPRVVISSGNGAIAVRGSCDSEPTPGTERPYCILGHDNMWREIRLRGDVQDERVVAMKDGRVVVVSPPLGDLTHARMTILDHDKARTVPLSFPEVRDPMNEILQLGVWLDGFEERANGKIGGWIEAAGTMIGIEIAPDGKVELGQYLRDAGSPIVSGRYGLGWTPSRRGYETVDGGMTWTPIELPEPIATRTTERACGPSGCAMAGWIRVGWGDPKKPAVPDAPAPFSPHASRPPTVTLTCERASPPQPDSHVKYTQSQPPPPTSRFPRGFPYGAPSFGPSVAGQAFPSVPLYATAPPATRPDERAISFEVNQPFEHSPMNGALGRVYVLAPRSGDTTVGSTRWAVRWVSPFGGWQDVESSPMLAAPQPVVDIARFASASSYYYAGWAQAQLAAGDDDAHALLMMRKLGHPEAMIFDLDADRAPVEITRADGEPFVDVDSAVRSGGRWFISTPTPQNSAELPRTLVWQVEGSIAHQVARVVRASFDGPRPSSTRLARRADNGAIGLVVDGQPNAEQAISERWVYPVAGDSANDPHTTDPEPLGAVDLSSKTIGACTSADGGWIVDEPWSGLPRISGAYNGTLSATLLRLRLSKDHACIERVAGVLSGNEIRTTAHSQTAPQATAPPTISVSILTPSKQRQAVRCTIAH